jgi:predicted RND superfamily exporter protein
VLIPALVMLSDETRLARAAAGRPESRAFAITSMLRRLSRLATRRRRLVGLSFLLLTIVAVPAISRIEVNDNPVKWFRTGSEVREATETLNERLPGTFTANLILETEDPGTMTQPEMLDWLDGLSGRWESTGFVGDSASYADLVSAETAAEADSQLTAAAERPLTATLISDDRLQANVRLQLNNGDNQAMSAVVTATDDYLETAPLPEGVTAEWAGETYLNLVWQDKMVKGMLEAFISTLVVVLVLMVALFRSVRWALLSVLPVLWTVLVVYGTIGLVGKDYDMPMAVLSTLVLGIGVDFAIHFVQRFRELHDEFGDRRAALRAFFEEPARALTRNALVIAVGFTPLFLSSLTPYVVVAAFLSSIIMLSWLATLLMLPAAVAGPSLDPADTMDADGDGIPRTPQRVPVMS